MTAATTRRTTAKANGVPFDVDAAARAAAAEAGLEPMPFTLRGQTFTIPPSKEWPIEVSSALAVNDLVAAIRLLLDADMDRFLAVHPTMGEVEALFGAVAEWSGVESAGN